MSKLRYPRLLLLLLSFVAAYVLFQMGFFDLIPLYLNGHGYISVFIGGLLFSYGFTSPFGIAILFEMGSVVNPIVGALLGACGAMMSDLLIFRLLRNSYFHEEIHRLKGVAPIQWIRGLVYHENVPAKVRDYLLWSIAGLLIASPLPDEIGVTLMSSVHSIEGKKFAALCYFFNAAGIFLILEAGKAVLG